MGSQPLTLKCPKCRAGTYGHNRPRYGIKRARGEPRRVVQYRVMREQARVHCSDCGHEWWTVHASWTNNCRAIGKSQRGALQRRPS